jgi:hypothetical protein
MKTHVEFRSAKFPPYDGEEEKINPGLWGQRLAEYLVAKLKEQGIETEGMNPEDWGWYVPIKNDGFRLAVCCGHQDGDADEFLCFIDPCKPTIRKWFKKIDTTVQVGRVAEALEKILAADPDIRDVKWLADEVP